MINRTIGFLGILASVMALSSLVYGAFHGQLYPNMQGVVGGVLEVYRTMRDGLFAGLGWSLSGLINFFGHWLDWLPPAPWFSLPNYLKDCISLYTLMGAAFTQRVAAYFTTKYFFDTGRENPYFADSTGEEGILWLLQFYLRLVLFFVAWPVFLRRTLDSRETRVSQPDYTYFDGILLPRQDLLNFFMCNGASFILGTAIFFLLVYAENRIGL